MALNTLLNNATANGPGTSLDCRNGKTAVFLISGVFDAAVKFEASLDGTTWFSFNGEIADDLKSSVTYSPSYVEFDVEGVAYIRPNVQNYRSGAVTVVGYVEARRLGSYSFQHFSATTAGTLVKSGPGMLHAVNIGDAGSGMAVSVYDGTSTAGTLIGVFKQAGSFQFDVAFNTGLFVVISATTMGDVCISYL